MNVHLAFVQDFLPPVFRLGSLLNPKITIIKLPAVEHPQVPKLKNATEGLCEVHVIKIAVGFHVLPYTTYIRPTSFTAPSAPYQHSLSLEFNSFATAHNWLHSQEGKTFFCFTSSKRICDSSWDELRVTYKPKSRNFQALKTDLDLIHWQEWSALYVISASPSHHAKVSKRVCNCCRYWKQSSLGFS